MVADEQGGTNADGETAFALTDWLGVPAQPAVRRDGDSDGVTPTCQKLAFRPNELACAMRPTDRPTFAAPEEGV